RANQVDAGAVGQALIDEVDVVIAPADPFEAGGDGGRDLDVALEMRVHERHLDQRLRLRVVVDEKNIHVAQVVLSSAASRRHGCFWTFHFPDQYSMHVRSRAGALAPDGRGGISTVTR